MRRFHLVLLLSVALMIGGCSASAPSAAIGGALPPIAVTPRPLATPPPAPTAAPTAAPAPAAPGPSAGVPSFGYRVVQSYPHDPGAFTQGLVYVGDDTFYEGTGLYGRSSLREVALGSAAPSRIINLDQQYFGEGIAVVGERIFQLTWQNGVGLIYNRSDFAQVGSFSYPPPGSALPAQGWGLTYDGQRLIMSDGTANLYFIDPQTMAFLGQIEVRDELGSPVAYLNELEYINGEVFANIWTTDTVIRIDPATGRLTGRINLAGLLTPEQRAQTDVLNGIAYDAAGDRLFVTGKLWPLLFEIDLVGPFAQYAPLVRSPLGVAAS